MRLRYTFIFLVTALAILLSGCGETVDADLCKNLKQSVLKTNAEKKYTATVMLEVVEAEELILFAQCEYTIDKTSGISMNGKMTQTVRETPSSFDVEYKNGVYTTVIGGTRSEVEMSESEFSGQFLCGEAIAFTPEEILSMEVLNNGDADLYRYKVKSGMKEKLSSLIGSDIYVFAKLKKPITEKTEFGEISCDYTVEKNGYL